MKIWLILDNSQRADLQGKLDLLHEKLIAQKLDSYKPSDTDLFGEIIDHPTDDLIAACFQIGNVTEWDESIREVIDQNDLVELTPDWSTEI